MTGDGSAARMIHGRCNLAANSRKVPETHSFSAFFTSIMDCSTGEGAWRSQLGLAVGLGLGDCQARVLIKFATFMTC